MPPRKLNPIAEKLLRLVHSGKTTKEKICVAADLKYPTLENVFSRQQVSYATLKSLKFAGIISERDEHEYRKWLLENDPKVRKSKKQEVDHASETGSSSDQPQEQAFGAEGADESEILDSGASGELDSLLPEN